MTVPISLKSDFDSTRGMLKRTTPFDADQLVGNAIVFLDSIRQYIVPADSFDRAFDAVAVHARDFRTVMAREGFPSRRDQASVEQARQLVLLALDRLDDALTEAKPNDMARAMGMDW
ncbi:hypothetical protein [Sphingomonas sp. PP-CE-1G-424]|uniref:hypothetical protein n=1 Tax=Sphingomonas sp. PP-CE-1G-424 TaxID=2135658 RepID=UPI001055C504|nr:hypothetical protein [Sphingomonas sp. PP-CE-1G-424]TCP65895.1 hypothetical protein C8J43_10899 [Sphingomonas sp. PP-CE-1G-424]